MKGKTYICTGKSFDYTIAPVTEAADYHWTIASGIGTLIQTSDTSFSLEAQKQTVFNICVDFTSSLGVFTQQCWNVFAYEIKTTILPTFYICKGGPDTVDVCGNVIRWGNGSPSLETAKCTLISYLGCDSIIITTILRAPTIIPIKSFYLCKGDSIKVFDKSLVINFNSCFLDTLITIKKGSWDNRCDSAVKCLFYNLSSNMSISKIKRSTSCTNGTKVLRAESNPCFGYNTYYWYKDGVFFDSLQEVSVSQSGLYTVVTKNKFYKSLLDTIFSYCSDSTSILIDINQADTLLASISPATNIFNTNIKSVTLTGIPSGGTFTGFGIIGNVFYPSNTGEGTYTITYNVLKNGCLYQATKTISVINIKKKKGKTSGLVGDKGKTYDFNDDNSVTFVTKKTTNNSQELLIRPNPTSNYFEILANNLTSVSTVKIIIADVLGQKIMENEIEVQNGSINTNFDLKSQPNGTYIVQIVDQDNIISKKILKNN